MSRLYIAEVFNLLQHWCIVGSNKLNVQKFRWCDCMDGTDNDCFNTRDDIAQSHMRAGIAHFYHVPCYKVGTPQINCAWLVIHYHAI